MYSTDSSPEVALDDKDGLPPFPPDFVEQAGEKQIDNIVPSRGYGMIPMVGLGGSAGSIPAVTEFFKLMPPDTGMAFAVILHLSPTHESTLAELLGRATSMPVLQASEGLRVLPNHVYVIPPGKYLAVVDDHFTLMDMAGSHGRQIAVDVFLRSLADTHGPHAVAVILSGANGDGAQGIRRIKERGGLTIAQDPDEAEQAGMPRAAIATHMVDLVLRIDRLPQRLIEFHENEKKLRLPPEYGPVVLIPQDINEIAFADLLVFMRKQTGHDLAGYKRATLLRRIARRMQVNGVTDMASYVAFLKKQPGEAGALLQDSLISVTNFFRDRDAFKALEQQIPFLFQGKTAEDSVRVWVPACATGEEAYSLGMLLLEHAGQLENAPTLQILASDLDQSAIQVARMGQYPETIAADVSRERLQRFFVKDSQGYRVRRELREIVLFSVHDLLKDPPFSRMDLVSCRNLLIYLNSESQERVLNTLHFALLAGGRLFLGASETIGDRSRLFEVLDKEHRIYVRRFERLSPLPKQAEFRAADQGFRSRTISEGPVIYGKNFELPAGKPWQREVTLKQDWRSTAELHLQLVEQCLPPSLVVNCDYNILHASQHAGRFLKILGGEPTTDVLRLVLPELRVELRAALFRATESQTLVETREIPAVVESEQCLVRIRVKPATETASGHLLVLFEARKPSDTGITPAQASPPSPKPETTVLDLEREVERVRTSLRDTVEEYETSAEELRANNEELQAMNEELRSGAQELETSREELQSINEELSSVNQEMKAKMELLTQANSDLQNLMASTAIATVFLDRELGINRYTPNAVDIFHLIPGDIGRPLADLRYRLNYPTLIADARKVLETLAPIEHEISDDGHWYLVRLQPYRTTEDQIAGVVLTLVEVTERHQAVQSMQQLQEQLRQLNAARWKGQEQILALRMEVNQLCTRIGEAKRYPDPTENPSPCAESA